MQMRWWLQGALIALCGAIIGIIFVYIPRPGKKSRLDSNYCFKTALST